MSSYPALTFREKRALFHALTKNCLFGILNCFLEGIFQIHDLTQDFYEQVLVLCLLTICFD